MWRSFFLALGLSGCLLGVECMMIDKAVLAQRGATTDATATLTSPREIKPPEWAPWSLLSAGAVVMLYTTTVRWQTDEARPLGVIPIDEPQARKIGQKPFMIDVRTAAALPITIEFFPHLERADRGIRGAASAGLIRKIGLVLEELGRRRIVIDVRGPSGR